MNTISQQSHAVHSVSTLTTDIVIDLGCCSYQRGDQLEDSIQALVKRFKPTVLFGFDPHPGLKEGIGNVYGSVVVTARKAAWTSNGWVGLAVNGNCTHLDDMQDGVVRTFDLVDWMLMLPDVPIVMKMDVEGAEYPLLEAMIERGMMGQIARLLVEFHDEPQANGYQTDKASILEHINCPIEEWQ